MFIILSNGCFCLENTIKVEIGRYYHIVNHSEEQPNSSLCHWNVLCNNYDWKRCVFYFIFLGGAMSHFNVVQNEIVQGFQSITRGWKGGLMMWYMRPFVFVWTSESLQRRSDISIVHRALWTELMVHFIDCGCCNLSIQARPAVAECRARSVGSSPAICHSKHSDGLQDVLPRRLWKDITWQIITKMKKYERKRNWRRLWVKPAGGCTNGMIKPLTKFKLQLD